jgi:signal peptidase I
MNDKQAPNDAAKAAIKTAEKTASDEKAKAPRNEGLALVKDIVAIVACWLLFTTFAWGAFHIPSGSMEPTLEVGDRIFVSKFAYGYNRYSAPFDPKFVFEDKIIESEPERGDVVVFTLPHRDNTDFIKRVIGLPGDTVQMKQGRLFVNGEMVERRFIRQVPYTNYQGRRITAKEYEETLPNGVKHRIYEQTDQGSYDNTSLFKVPAGHYFMMGDNRDGSADSRARGSNAMGFVKIKYIVGRADVTTFSLYDCDQGKDVGCALGIPYGRFFNSID